MIFRTLQVLAPVLLMVCSYAMTSCSSDDEEEENASTNKISTSVSMDQQTLQMQVGDQQQLTYSFTCDDSTIAPTVTWISSIDSVATVSDDGVVTALKAGQTAIKVQCTWLEDVVEDSCVVTVSNVEATALVLSCEELILKIDETYTLTYTIEPETTTVQTVTWTSKSTEIAVVEDGVITAMSVGSTYIVATCGEVSAKCLVNVAYKDITEIKLSASELELELESSSIISASVNENASSDSINWTTSDESIATVSSDGTVTAIALGTCTITASSPIGDVQASCEITVVPIKVSGVTINGTYDEIVEGQTFDIDFTISPSNAANTDVVISSSNTSVVVVNSDGSLTAKETGSATITVTTDDGGYYDTCDVTVVSIEDYITKKMVYGYSSVVFGNYSYVGYYIEAVLINTSSVPIYVTELSIYESGSLVSSITYSQTLAAGESIDDKYTVSSGSYTIVWTYTYNGSTYQK